MSLYYYLYCVDDYFAEAVREEGNWIEIYVIGKRVGKKCILFDGKVHIDAIPLWINKKSLKSDVPFEGQRLPWIPISELPDEFLETKEKIYEVKRM